MSLKRAVKAVGFKDFMKMGLALATSRKMAIASPPKNEVQRCNKVIETNIIGRELSSQFEIFAEVAKMITGAKLGMINILDGKDQFTIGGSGMTIDPLLAMPQKLSVCQFALSNPEPLIIPDLSEDERFSETHITKPPVSAKAYSGFPLVTKEGFVLGTLCVFYHSRSQISDEQIRLMKQLAKAVTDQIILRNEQANLNAEKIAAMLGRFLRFSPKGKIDELVGFLNFCANGAAPPEILTKLKKDNIVVKVDGCFVLSQDGNDLKDELGLAERGYLGNQPSEPSVGRRLDDLLSDLE
tara:strand:- start:120 stop:1010 length:891 start_codon:yes stop_codon:yes gene_type:complete